MSVLGHDVILTCWINDENVLFCAPAGQQNCTLGLESREAVVTEEAVALGAVEEGRFGVVGAVGGAFALVSFLSEVVLLENVCLGGTGPAVTLLKRGLGAAFNLEVLTAGCDRIAKVNNQWQKRVTKDNK